MQKMPLLPSRFRGTEPEEMLSRTAPVGRNLPAVPELPTPSTFWGSWRLGCPKSTFRAVQPGCNHPKKTRKYPQQQCMGAQIGPKPNQTQFLGKMSTPRERFAADCSKNDDCGCNNCRSRRSRASSSSAKRTVPCRIMKLHS